MTFMLAQQVGASGKVVVFDPADWTYVSLLVNVVAIAGRELQ